MAATGAPDTPLSEQPAAAAGPLPDIEWYHSIELPDGRVTPGAQGLEQLRKRLAQFPLPQDLSGRRALDIGAWDGWFSFEMERRGAQVVAADFVEKPGFLFARERLGSQVDYRVLDVYDLSPETVGRFDLVLFLGVLYHLKHPLLALEKVCAVCTDAALIESYVTGDSADGGEERSPVARMEFYETDELRGQADNWCGPNIACLLAFCRTAGFARVELCSVVDQRAHVMCYRRWLPEPDRPAQPAPKVVTAVNLYQGARYLASNRDDYLSIWFKTPEKNLAPHSVFPQVGGYGVQPVYVGPTEDDGWQANCKLPPGLPPGWHEVRLRTAQSRFSDPVQIAVDQPRRPPKVEHLNIEIVADGKSWDRNILWLSQDSCLSMWISGLPQGAELEDIGARLGEHELRAVYLSSPDKDRLRQVNAQAPKEVSPGEYGLTVRCGGKESPAVRVRALRR